MRLPVIAKIEKPQAVDNLDEIIDAFDGVMVARGDLGVELPLEEVPLVQKRAIEIARRNAKPVIVATQVLESMIENSAPDPRRGLATAPTPCSTAPTRSCCRGRPASASTRSRRSRTMAQIIESTEEHGLDRMADRSAPSRTRRVAPSRPPPPRSATCSAPSTSSRSRQSGDSAKRLSRIRSKLPMLAFTPDAVHPLAAGAHLGHRDLPGADGQAHRPDGPPGRRVAAGVRPLRRGRHSSSSSPARLPASPARPTPCGSTSGRRGQQGRAGLRGPRRSHHRVLTQGRAARPDPRGAGP